MVALRKVNPDHFVEEMANEDVGTCLAQFACLSMAIVRQGGTYANRTDYATDASCAGSS